jgi:triacylglycerol lipase
MTTRPAQVILVPGFFGFGRLGDISYFAGVRAALVGSLARRGIAAELREVLTPPTASIRQRAARVLEALALAAQADGDIHLVGHSTGGLDVRLAIAETAALPTDAVFEDYERVRSVVSVACPHYGTGTATYFTRPLGRVLFRRLARYGAFMLERGRLPLKILLRLGYFVVRLRDPFKKRRSTFDELYERLLNDLNDDRRRELVQFLRQIADEQALLFQLTPAGCDLLNACTLDPPVAYGSIVTCAARPRLGTWLRSLLNLYAQIMYPLYWFLHRASRERDANLRLYHSEEQLATLDAQLGHSASGDDSDGVVASLSQVWGRVLHVAKADHLDVVGQYGASGDEGGGDWLPSASGFDRAAFEALWDSVAAFIAAAPTHSVLRRDDRDHDAEHQQHENHERHDATDRADLALHAAADAAPEREALGETGGATATHRERVVVTHDGLHGQAGARRRDTR